jgi:hypothetical protein
MQHETYRVKARTLQNNFAQYNSLKLINRYAESFLDIERTIRATYEHSNA